MLGGAETLLSRFALLAPRAGIQISVACLREWDGNPAAAPLHAAGVHPVNLDLIGRPGPGQLLAVRRHIAAVGPQIVHTHLGSSDLLGGIAGRSLGIPVVNTIHTTQWRQRRTIALRRVAHACADRVIAVSDSARREYLRMGLPHPERVIMIHNGTDVEVASGAGPDVRRELGLTSEDFVVAMVSALRPEKGHAVAIEAVRRLRSRYPQLRLVIVGQGELRDQLARTAADLGPAVVLTGLRPDVARVLDAADAFLQPSLQEAFPTTILEAMAAGVPVIATSVGGVPEIIEGPQLGILIPAPPAADDAARAIAALVEAPDRRRELGRAGRAAYVQRFTAQPWLDRTRALYDDVLAQRTAGRSQRAAGAGVPLPVRGR